MRTLRGRGRTGARSGLAPASATCMVRLGVLLLAVWPSTGHAAHGSDGAFAPSPVGTTTLVMPSDGIFHFATINIPAGATVRFTPNAANTLVFRAATGNVVVDGVLIGIETHFCKASQEGRSS